MFKFMRRVKVMAKCDEKVCSCAERSAPSKAQADRAISLALETLDSGLAVVRNTRKAARRLAASAQGFTLQPMKK